jgi:hypothetical protein
LVTSWFDATGASGEELDFLGGLGKLLILLKDSSSYNMILQKERREQ